MHAHVCWLGHVMGRLRGIVSGLNGRWVLVVLVVLVVVVDLP